MIEGIPKISVLVITYNQEDLIGRAIDSLLTQKDYLYEICVSDDCSKDRTWQILQEYSQKYPGLFKLNRNDPNLGIFQNVEKTWEMPTGDLICRLSGDDESGQNWFEKVVRFVKDNNLDCLNDAFCIYGDYSAIYPNGDSFVYSNRLAAKGDLSFSLSIRGLIGNRGSCYSRCIHNQLKKVSQGKSYIAEDAQDRQVELFSKRSYYIPWVANVYYARIGVCVSINKDSQRYSEYMHTMNYLAEFVKESGVDVSKEDYAFMKIKYAKQTGKHFQAIRYRLQSLTFRIAICSLKVWRRYAFAALRRIPHKKPIKNFSV